jgi:hypothetical protein
MPACQFKLLNVQRIIYQDLSGNKFATVFLAISRISAGVEAGVLLRAKKVGHQISVSFEKFDVVQALLSFF